ncbi:hypothetical protein GCM10010388_16800 [Streptomyces mauvecolor]
MVAPAVRTAASAWAKVRMARSAVAFQKAAVNNIDARSLDGRFRPGSIKVDVFLAYRGTGPAERAWSASL